MSSRCRSWFLSRYSRKSRRKEKQTPTTWVSTPVVSNTSFLADRRDNAWLFFHQLESGSLKAGNERIFAIFESRQHLSITTFMYSFELKKRGDIFGTPSRKEVYLYWYPLPSECWMCRQSLASWPVTQLPTSRRRDRCVQSFRWVLWLSVGFR